VLPGLGEFFLQCFRLEHRIAISLEHLRFCSRQQLLLGYSALMADRLLKGTDNLPSSIARPSASPPSYTLLLLGR
jgi:hypothetical protein